MSIHDALEAWAEGRLPVERALALTHAVDVAELLVLCGLNGVPRPLLTGPPPADEGYSPESIHVLAGLERPVRHPVDPLWRWAGEFLAPPEPVLDYSHRLLPDGTPRYPLNDAELVRHMRERGFSEADIRHVLGYDPGILQEPGYELADD